MSYAPSAYVVDLDKELRADSADLKLMATPPKPLSEELQTKAVRLQRPMARMRCVPVAGWAESGIAWLYHKWRMVWAGAVSGRRASPGLVTLEQMTSALTVAVENPALGTRIVTVPEIRRARA